MKIVTNRVDGSTRVETRKGREYLVSPIVILREGVVNGRLVPGEEIERFVDGWNGRPVPVRHPKRGDEYVSANSLDILDEVVIGNIFNAQYDDGALKGDIWIDVQRAKAMGEELANIVTNLQQNVPYEISSGYWAEGEDVSGEWNGVQYNSIDRKLVPDHVAILPDEIGACSWSNGCGTPRVNQEIANTSFISEGVRFIVNALTGKETKMKDCYIKDITANSKLSEDFLRSLDEDALKVLSEALTPEEDEAETVVEEPVVEPVTNSAKIELPAEFKELMGEMRKIVANARQAQDQEKANTVARILANASDFTEAELKAMSIETLRKLETKFAPADYSGRGAAFSANVGGDWEEYVKPEVK